MDKTMLIDAYYQDEVRVAVVNEKAELENFEIESKTKTNTKGNIYLAKVLRIEPSLQAVFVDYGNDKQGFLSFSNIHPDYYQKDTKNESEQINTKENNDFANLENAIAESKQLLQNTTSSQIDVTSINDNSDNHFYDKDDDEQELEIPKSQNNEHKLQDVIKSKQILLVQVVKEERGNKCAALTTYISLAGRYCILMPNSVKKNAISKKITNQNARERIKNILDEINTEPNFNIVLRSAGEKKTKNDIKKDYDFLAKLWSDVQKLFSKTKTPSLIHKESCLVKRSLRDLYNKDVKNIFVSGEEAYKIAKNFMNTLIPSHARRVKQYKDQIPIFHKYEISKQIDSAYSTRVPLPSGGYLIINPTEALVSIDVNSGKATKEKNIEETAVATNLEAAKEIAKQIIIRNMSGLMVIDFIDMTANNNNVLIEKTLKSYFKHDKAKVHITKISKFGLIEISRQRLRPSMVETFFSCCPLCDGFGLVNDINFAALRVVRAINDYAIKQNSPENICVKIHSEILNHIFNYYKRKLIAIEENFNKTIEIKIDNTISLNNYVIENTLLSTESKNKKAKKTPNQNNKKPDSDKATKEDNTKKNKNENNKKNKEPNKKKAKNPPPKTFSIAKPTNTIIEEIYDSNQDNNQRNLQNHNNQENQNAAPKAQKPNNSKRKNKKQNNIKKIKIIDVSHQTNLETNPSVDNSVIEKSDIKSKVVVKKNRNKSQSTSEKKTPITTPPIEKPSEPKPNNPKPKKHTKKTKANDNEPPASKNIAVRKKPNTKNTESKQVKKNNNLSSDTKEPDDTKPTNNKKTPTRKKKGAIKIEG